MTDIEPHIIRDSREGNREAFRLLVRHYQQPVYSLAVKMLCDDEDAKDATQEVFIRVWANLHRYDPGQRFVTWIYTITTRVCLNMLKSRRPLQPLGEDDGALQRICSASDGHLTLEGKELSAIIRRLTEGLGQKQRIVFTLCLLEGLTVEQVREITGMSAIQIKSNLYMARRTVKGQLKKLGYE